MAKLFSANMANEMSEKADLRGVALKILESDNGVFSRIKHAADIGEKSIRITRLSMPANRGCFMAAVDIMRENGYKVDFNIAASNNEITTIDISWGDGDYKTSGIDPYEEWEEIPEGGRFA